MIKMPKISVEIDTEEETMVVKIGDETVKDVGYITIASPSYGGGGYYTDMYVSIQKTEKSEDGVVKYTTYTLASDAEAKKKVNSGESIASNKYKGFVESVGGISPVIEQLSDFVSSRLKDRAKRKR